MFGFFDFLIVVAICLFVIIIVKIGTDYCLKVERIRRGYPEDGSKDAGKDDHVVDYRSDRLQ